MENLVCRVCWRHPEAIEQVPLYIFVWCDIDITLLEQEKEKLNGENENESGDWTEKE